MHHWTQTTANTKGSPNGQHAEFIMQGAPEKYTPYDLFD